MCLPAWQLYSGTGARFYPRVDINNWTNPKTDVKILSALFGWIKHTDLIPIYNLAMNDKILINNSSNFIYNYWKNNIDLNNYIDFNNDIDLLSNKYRKALNIQGKHVANIPDEKWKDKHGYYKGLWLNSQLELI
jgi:cytoplasmic iron level regulating protein YaaA (DUF328/UPF0246 family)